MKDLNNAIDTLQSIASSIIETQEAMAVLNDETKLTLQHAGEECLKLELTIRNLRNEVNCRKLTDEEVKEFREKYHDTHTKIGI